MKQHGGTRGATARAPPGSNWAIAKYLGLGMLLLLAGCTIITAGMLLTRTIDKPSDALGVLAGRQSVVETTTPAADADTRKPLTKELDPDYIEAKTRGDQAVTYGKKCPPGCEKQGNCNAEEGR